MIDSLLARTVKCLLRLRYRVRLVGLDQVARQGRAGILFLPNHPALIDPIILLAHLYGRFKPRALADRDQIDRFLIRRLARRLDVLPIPDMAKAASASAEEVRKVLAQCAEVLRRGGNLILYPAGHALHGYLEEIGGSSAVETILRELPEVRVVLVRMRGLWGSSFSWASGAEPDVAGALLHGTRSLLVSGVFFAPRRDVSIELIEPDDLPRHAERATINRYLEGFYNDGARANTYVPYTAWEGGGVRELPEPPRAGIEGDPARVPRATRQIVRDYLEDLTGRACHGVALASRADLDDRARLGQDLGMDSLSATELLTWLGSEFGFPPGDVSSLRTVGDVMLAACGESVSAAPTRLKEVPARWFRGPPRPHRPDGLADMTIPQAFLHQARLQPGAVIMADQTGGVRTYRDVVVGVMVLTREIEALPGDRVGIMMPASVAANVLYLAVLFAGKTPVMVNWTLGRRNLQHCLEMVGVERILTARAVVSRIDSQGSDLGAVRDRLVHLEDLAAGLSRRAKLRAWLASRLSWSALRAAADKAPRTAAILFTSGSEDVPKAVPLTHRNMLTNVSDAYECFTITRNDSVLGILPPFHSFGLTTSMLLPLCLGLRAAYYPNPTDGRALGQVIEAYRATILIGTPTFLDGIVRASDASRLASLRLVVSGAEKCPPRVYRALARRCPQTVVMEGYGVTECSPVISVNHERDARAGTIGRVMPSLEHAVVEPETNRRVAPGAEGMLLVRGPSVFEGYLGGQGPSPFVDFDHKRWYRTGDLVREDEQGVLTFRGPLKRFVKLGGEMISLPAIESVLDEHFRSEGDEGPVLAVTAAEEQQPPEIVLVTTKDVDRDAANRSLRSAGLSGLHNIRRVIRVEALPLLGSGKTDYRALTERL